VEEFSFPAKETNGFSGEAASCKIIRVTFWRMAFLKKYAVLFGITRLFLKGKDKAARRAQFPRRARTKLLQSACDITANTTSYRFPHHDTGLFQCNPASSYHDPITGQREPWRARPSTDGCRFQPPVPRCLSKITARPWPWPSN
jgi:hypothetical protein